MVAGQVYVVKNQQVFLQSVPGTAPSDSNPKKSSVTGWTDISKAVHSCELMVNIGVADVPFTMGSNSLDHELTGKYDWSVNLDVITDGFGANTINKIFEDAMGPPLGGASGTGQVKVAMLPGSGTSGPTNPVYHGNLLVATWKPFGPGVAGTIARQSFNLKGSGDIAVIRTAP